MSGCLCLQVINVQAQLHRNCKLYYDSTGCKCGTYEILRHVYPWIVHMYHEDKSKECMGALINNWYVLASATCALNSRKDTIKYFKATFQHMDRDTTETNITDVIIHPDYDPTGKFTTNELMLFKLEREIDMNNRSPACLPKQNDVLPKIKNIYVFQWKYEGKRRKFVERLDLQKCFAEANATKPEDGDSKYICVGGKDVDVCGTTGTLLMASFDNQLFTLYGITSNDRVINMCKNKKIGLFTKLSPYVEWIKENTKDAKYCK
ncbi:Chymotrypsin-like elastase family member 2A [Portunus trituberculatus]|uniref:Chymotrypsin-like elastase family member 2A n=1 Tax=Portunus trituberculatus TaxID=210409 RepID=A0A5B7JDU3_PORTR|nr:Chymotrypsin-like elastase family member 2A [Portunus trituberculatus]